MHFLSFFKKLDSWLVLGLGCVFVRGLFVDVMDVDASQYASISMEMWQGGSWLEVMHRHTDYLDKPPLLFWLSAASMGVFGFTNFAYKLPALVAAVAGIWATYRFAKIFYPEKTAQHAALVLASSLGLMLMTNDVRTDILLLGTTACAVWQLAEYQQQTRWPNLLAAFFCIGLAMLAKGPIGLVVPAFAVGSHLLLRRDWRGIFRWQWLVGLLVVAVVLAPMCWGLWHQFDLHPEKPLRDRRTTSGLYFFFWEQSFGRVTGENVWHDDSTPLYFVHTYLWAFAPWSLLFVGALWARFRAIFGQKLCLPVADEGYSIGAFVLTFAALSTSNYKLPHYIFVTLPWASVLLARWLGSDFWAVASRRRNVWVWVQAVVCLLVMLLAWAAPGYFFSENSGWMLAGLAVVFGGTALLLAPLPTDESVGCESKILQIFCPQPTDSSVGRLVRPSVVVAIGFGFALNFWFYPHLLPYQSTSQVGRYLRENDISAERVGFFKRHGHALDFYAGGITRELKTPAQIRETAAELGGFWLYTTEAGREELAAAGVAFVVERAFPHFQAARLRGDFLNPATREKSLEPTYLLKIKPL
ncbi:MAG: glycosyltransferase family 39 protein [Saprospiraceae bacterium]